MSEKGEKKGIPRRILGFGYRLIRGGPETLEYERQVVELRRNAEAISRIRENFQDIALSERRAGERRAENVNTLKDLTPELRQEVKEVVEERIALKSARSELSQDKDEFKELRSEINSLQQRSDKFFSYKKNRSSELRDNMKPGQTFEDVVIPGGDDLSQNQRLEQLREKIGKLNDLTEKYKGAETLTAEVSKKILDSNPDLVKKSDPVPTYAEAMKASIDKLAEIENSPKKKSFDAQYSKQRIGKRPQVTFVSEDGTADVYKVKIKKRVTLLGQANGVTAELVNTKTGDVTILRDQIRAPKNIKDESGKIIVKKGQLIDSPDKEVVNALRVMRDGSSRGISGPKIKTEAKISMEDPARQSKITLAVKAVAEVGVGAASKIDQYLKQQKKDNKKALKDNKVRLSEARESIRKEKLESLDKNSPDYAKQAAKLQPMTRLQRFADKRATTLGIEPRELLNKYVAQSKEIDKIEKKIGASVDKNLDALEKLAKKNGIEVDIKAEIKAGKSQRDVVNEVNNKLVEAMEKNKDNTKEYEKDHKIRGALTAALRVATLGGVGSFSDLRTKETGALKERLIKTVGDTKRNTIGAVSQAAGAAVAAVNVLKTALTKGTNKTIDLVNEAHKKRTKSEVPLINPERKFEESTFKGNLEEGRMARLTKRLLNPNETAVNNAKVDVAKMNARNNLDQAKKDLQTLKDVLKDSTPDKQQSKALENGERAVNEAKQNLAKAGPIARAEIVQQDASKKLAIAQENIAKLKPGSKKFEAAQSKVAKYQKEHDAAKASVDRIKDTPLSDIDVNKQTTPQYRSEKIMDATRTTATNVITAGQKVKGFTDYIVDKAGKLGNMVANSSVGQKVERGFQSLQDAFTNAASKPTGVTPQDTLENAAINLRGVTPEPSVTPGGTPGSTPRGIKPSNQNTR